jgi:hypothetical protein
MRRIPAPVLGARPTYSGGIPLFLIAGRHRLKWSKVSAALFATLALVQALTGCACVTSGSQITPTKRCEAYVAPQPFTASPLEGAPVRCAASNGLALCEVIESPELCLYRIERGRGGGTATLATRDMQIVIRDGAEGPDRYVASFRSAGCSSCGNVLMSAAHFTHTGRLHRGTLLLLSGVLPSSLLEQSLISSARERGWDVVVVAGLVSRMAGWEIGGSPYSIRTTSEVSPEGSRTSGSKRGATTAPKGNAQHASSPPTSLAARPLEDYTRDQWLRINSSIVTDGDFLARSMVATHLLMTAMPRSGKATDALPIVVVGVNQGAMALPTVVETLRRHGLTPAASVFVAGGANLAAIVRRGEAAEGLELLGCTLSADDRCAVVAEATRYDPVTTAAACLDRPALMVNATFDDYVPKECRDALALALGDPERWDFPVNHAMLLLYAPLGSQIIAWVEGASRDVVVWSL